MKPEALDKLKKLAEYIERSCDEWFITYPNRGDSDMAFQRMYNFKMDIHEILESLGEFDGEAVARRALDRMHEYMERYSYDPAQVKKIKHRIKDLQRVLAK